MVKKDAQDERKTYMTFLMDSHVKAYKRMLWKTVKQDIKAIELLQHTKSIDVAQELYALISKNGYVKEVELK